MSDTIFALATAAGRAGVAVIRISGPAAGDVLSSMGGRRPASRLASVRRLRDPETGETLDQALVLWMPGPASFTGEDVAELHLHGGRAVVGGVLQALSHLGLRPAEPGEFTRRAFEGGRLDLSEAEAVADLVDAETGAQRRQALQLLGGALTQRTEQWRSALIEALAGLEAAIDFPDEDLPETVVSLAIPPLRALLADVRAASEDKRGERVREGFHVALIGAPNAGKSTLLNILAGRDAAIVTDVAGTTRDVIEAPLDIAGYRVVLADTAGLREVRDVVEREGVRRALARAALADLRLWVVDQSGEHDDWREAANEIRAGDILVLMKSDLPQGAEHNLALDHARALGLDLVKESVGSPEAGNGVRRLLEERVISVMSGADAPAISRERHRVALTDAAQHLERALGGQDPELMAEDVRLAARALERISGRVDSEAVLDRVFAAFCIGK